MPLSEPYEIDGVTVGASELSVISGTTSLQTNTTPGIYTFWVDVATMAKSDQFIFRVYEKVEATGGTKRVVWSQVLKNAQSTPLIFPPLMLMNGWDMTIQKQSGTDRAFDATIRAATGGNLTEFAELDGVSIGVTEWSIVTNTAGPDVSTSEGIYQVLVDPLVAPMAKADEFELRLYEKVEATGGTQRLFWKTKLMDAQVSNLATPMFHLRNGWDATLIKISGTDRAFDASIRKVV